MDDRGLPDAVTADVLDGQQIDQLHAATLQISANCFELKRICATVLAAAGTLIASFTHTKLEGSLFLGGLLLITVFWIADAQSYYIQAKLRRRMTELQSSRAARVVALAHYDVSGVGLPSPIYAGGRRTAVRRALFNASMLYYLLLCALLTLSWGLFEVGAIS